MLRLVLLMFGVLAASMGFAWLADNPGTITIDWQGYRAEPTILQAVVILSLLVALGVFLYLLFKQFWSSPAALGQFLTRRRQRRGLDALSSGMIAVGAGDRSMATRYAIQARKSLPNEPLTHLLRAQAAHLSGDKTTARRIFEAMLASPDTEQLGLRGLFLEATREGETEAARQFAERAAQINSKLAWPLEALFELQCKAQDWAGALESLSLLRRNGEIENSIADRRRAVLLTAQAQALEELDSHKALSLALEAHGLASSLIPAAAIAGRLLASKGNTSKAAVVLQKTWTKAPHPELATAYAYARIGDSPRDRFDRVLHLASLNPHATESTLAIAEAALDSRFYDEARSALESLQPEQMSRRAAMLMARLEAEQNGDKGRVREWIVRAANAPRDPAWTADGIVSEQWSAVSPVTGALDAFQWKVPVEEPAHGEAESLSEKLAAFAALDVPSSMDDDSDGSAPLLDLEPAKETTQTAAPHQPAGVEASPRDAAADSRQDGVDSAEETEPPARQARA